jgi:hypothetical protein
MYKSVNCKCPKDENVKQDRDNEEWIKRLRTCLSSLFRNPTCMCEICKGKLPLSVLLVINDNPYGLMFSLSFL